MAKRPLKRPTDPLQLAKLIGDIATGEVVDERPTTERSARMAEIGRKGGIARSASLPDNEKEAIARKGGQARSLKK